MRYKSLFRVLVKVISVYLIAAGAASVMTVIGQISVFELAVPRMTAHSYTSNEDYWSIFLRHGVPGLTQIIVGIALFWLTNWIANFAIPGNRVYCSECEYDLTHVFGAKCPECGTVISKGDPLAPEKPNGPSSSE